MKKSQVKRAIILVSFLYLIGAVLFISKAFANDGKSVVHSCYRVYATGGCMGIWHCPGGWGECTFVDVASLWLDENNCYTQDPLPE